LSGRIDDDVDGSCPAVRFELKGYRVRTTSSTQFSGGNCRDLREDRRITLTGELEGPRAVRATRIEINR
jgi:hypothetical protein